MDKSIENIWKEGFANEKLLAPKINALYNQKSIGVVEKVIHQFKKEILFLIPLAFCVFLFNILLDNTHAVFWGIISAIPCLFWFYLGKKQVKSIQNINYETNSYQYLISVRSKLLEISQFNKKIAVSSVPIILFPMLIYTYYKQAGKTIGEIFGVEGIDLPTVTIFLILPIITGIAIILANWLFKKGVKERTSILDDLIQEMETLRGETDDTYTFKK